ncbi:septum formation protein [Evansella caseinilytica]|uniref:dTTP/UTP pyrophosphatase n=1 Tax=Evansella caseinilytica TaxID=1503961 RepID=A0A1H3PSV0_9BACI|nr:Maf family protein [Evansella caseinilytica]SDZ04023.1 septum formation protein [Evansella caseinilytica]
MKPFILASQSPRRKQLLEQVQLSFSIEQSRMEEIINQDDSPQEAVASLAHQKARDVFLRNRHHVVIGADTIVVIDGEILGKPADEKEAKAMLNKLSGRTHHVYTGVSIVSEDKTITFTETAEVHFYELSTEEIDAYVRSGDPFDKAGGYGIQGIGATLVEKIHGDYFTIVGLPIAKVVRALKDFQ